MADNASVQFLAAIEVGVKHVAVVGQDGNRKKQSPRRIQ
jgi:hypothetical protein